MVLGNRQARRLPPTGAGPAADVLAEVAVDAPVVQIRGLPGAQAMEPQAVALQLAAGGRLDSRSQDARLRGGTGAA